MVRHTPWRVEPLLVEQDNHLAYKEVNRASRYQLEHKCALAKDNIKRR